MEAAKKAIEKMDWITEKQLKDATTKLEDFNKWWTKVQALAEKTPLTDPPAYRKDEVKSQAQKPLKAFDKLRKIKKPKNKKKGKKEDKKEKPLPDVGVDLNDADAIAKAIEE